MCSKLTFLYQSIVMATSVIVAATYFTDKSILRLLYLVGAGLPTLVISSQSFAYGSFFPSNYGTVNGSKRQ